MLDIKNEQKWPLTEKEVRKEQTVKGHFFCAGARKGVFYLLETRQKKGAAQSRPNIFIIPQMKNDVNIYLSENAVFGGLN